MKKSSRIYTVLRVALAFVISAAALLGISYIYLSANLSDNIETDTSKESVPYKAIEESRGLLFEFEDGSAALIYLDFEILQVTAVLIEDHSPEKVVYAGYSADYTLSSDRFLIEGIIDRVGGIELTVDGERLRYTGVQVTELLYTDKGKALKKDILSAVLEKISENGFSRDDFVFLIENSDTALTLPDCYTWHEDIALMCSRANILILGN